jgi:uncharacterized membrane protein YphA (DoxX/SURF4 family)
MTGDPDPGRMDALQSGAAPAPGASLSGLIGSSPGVGLALRAALASPFLASGLLKLLDWNSALAEFAALGIWAPQITVAAVILTQVCGSLLLLTSRGAWLGAGILAVFTMVATLIGHPFWLFEGASRVRQLTTFLEHVAIIGGLAVVALFGAASAPAGRGA